MPFLCIIPLFFVYYFALFCVLFHHYLHAMHAVRHIKRHNV